MQMKITMRYHLRPVRMAIIKKIITRASLVAVFGEHLTELPKESC